MTQCDELEGRTKLKKKKRKKKKKKEKLENWFENKPKLEDVICYFS